MMTARPVGLRCDMTGPGEVPRLSRRRLFKLGGLLSLCPLAGPLLPLDLPGEPASGFAELRSRWQSHIDRYPYVQSAIAVTDLQTGFGAHVNGFNVQQPGCTVNLAVVICAVQDIQAGVYPEAELRTKIQNTISYSNPVLAHDLLVSAGRGDVRAGIERVQALFDSLGLRDTLFHHPPAYFQGDLLTGTRNATTASDMTKMLAALWNGQLLDAEWTQYVLDRMTRVWSGLNYLIAAGVPEKPEIKVGHKNGWFRDFGLYVDNDIGIVWEDTERERYAYAIALLFEKVPGLESEWLGRTLSRETWEYFDQRGLMQRPLDVLLDPASRRDL